MSVCSEGFDRELKRQKEASDIVLVKAPHFGRNKKREISRLLYEISKIENIPPKDVLIIDDKWHYRHIKGLLLKRRFPKASSEYGARLKAHLPELSFSSELCADLTRTSFSPKKIYIENDVRHTAFASKIVNSFPSASIIQIHSLKEFRKERGNFTVGDYNSRADSLFVVSQGEDYFKRCPCTKKALGCGYHVFNLAFGCIYECTYCFLQGYANTHGIILPANLDDFFDNMDSYVKAGMRFGTGEFSDSLMLDHATEYSCMIIDFMKIFPDVTFEFKTKSANIDNLIKTKHNRNIVVSWSVNPQRVIDENEFYSASLSERLAAISKCQEAGYKIGLHFDPIIYSSDFKELYSRLIEDIFKHVNLKNIAWISLGTLRFAPLLKQVIEKRFPVNKILDSELVFGFDGKLRYTNKTRFEIYQYVLQTFGKFSKNLPIYLCMEDRRMHRALKLKSFQKYKKISG